LRIGKPLGSYFWVSFQKKPGFKPSNGELGGGDPKGGETPWPGEIPLGEGGEN